MKTAHKTDIKSYINIQKTMQISDTEHNSESRSAFKNNAVQQ